MNKYSDGCLVYVLYRVDCIIKVYKMKIYVIKVRICKSYINVKMKV